MEDVRNEYNKILDSFNTLLEQTTIYQQSLTKELSDLDLEKSDILHFVELEKFNITKGFKIVRRLRNILKRRRDVKNELVKMQQVQSKITENKVILNKKLAKVEDKKYYTYKTDILSDLGFSKDSTSSKEI